MAQSDVQICNIALSRIGVTMTIASLEERSKEAMSCKLLYETVRDRVLAAAPWPFARAGVVLQLTGTAPERWAYRYQYPADCLAVRFLHPALGAGSGATLRLWERENRVPYELASGENDNLTICTDLQDAIAEYTRKITNPLRFDGAFTSALAWALAAELALPLARGIDFAKNAGNMYQQEIAMALASRLNEEQQEKEPESEFVRARA